MCYFHTLDVPFYYDDNDSLRDNPAIQGIHLDTLWNSYSARIVGYFTFAANYSIHGYDVAGYHLVNIAIHVLATLFVYLITALLIRTPVLSEKATPVLRTWLPLVTALIFAAHPLQIQAITYIVQRLASLAALFYLISFYCYLKGRLSDSTGRQAGYFILALAAFLLAFSTKQNAITLPLAWLLAEMCFFRVEKKTYMIGAGLILALFLAGLLLAPFILNQPLFEFLDTRTRETNLFSRTQYLSVQMHVLWEYIIKFFIPVNLTLNYEHAIPASFFEPATLTKAVLHVSVLLAALLLRKRAPVAAFGILFYYGAHIVESSIIPIRDFGFDHRTYLPNFGLCLIAGWLATILVQNRLSPKIPWLIAIYILVLAGLTWHRNNTWRDPIAFFSHETQILDDSFRAYCFLGQAYYEAGNIAGAISTYRQGWAFRSGLINRGNNTFSSCSSNFAATLQEGGNLEESRQLIAELPVSSFQNEIRAKITVTLGNIEALSQNYPEAESLFTQARELDPRNIDAISNLAKLKILTGDLDASYELFKLVNQLDPTDPDGIIGLQYLEQVRQQ